MIARLRLASRLLAWMLRIGFSLMGVGSYFAYSTVGFDFETPTPQGVDARYYRLRWDDGSFWIGTALQPCPRPNRELDWFDLGGTLFVSPTHPLPRSWWNRWGFWSIQDPSDDPYATLRYVGAKSSRWWGCPAWLVVLPLWIWPVWRTVRKGSNAVAG